MRQNVVEIGIGARGFDPCTESNPADKIQAGWIANLQRTTESVVLAVSVVGAKSGQLRSDRSWVCHDQRTRQGGVIAAHVIELSDAVAVIQPPVSKRFQSDNTF